MFKLRDYQKQLIEDVREEFRQGRKKTCLVAPCGAGKTVIMAHMAARAASRGQRVLFTVHRTELIDQSSKALIDMGVHHGLIAAGYPADFSLPVQVGSIFSIIRRLEQMQAPDLIIFDEAHHCKASSWLKLLQFYPDSCVVGLTATPMRMGGDGLGDIFDSLTIGPTVKQLTTSGRLAPFKYYAPPVKANLNGVRVKYGEYVKSDVAYAMDQANVIGDAIETYTKLAAGKQAVCYCSSVEHSKHTAELFRKAGIAAMHIDGETNRHIRKDLIDRFRRDEFKIITNVDLISEGFDVPNMEAVILLRPTQSLTLHVQQSMRPMRPSDNPDKVAIIIDHVGNCYRHGLPDEDRIWTLETAPKKPKQEREFLLRQCPKCFAAHRPGPKCPECGYIYPVEERTQVTQLDGELVKIDELERQRKKQEIKNAKSIPELEQIAIARGYRLGWINKMAELKHLGRR